MEINSSDTILVQTIDSTQRRGISPLSVNVEELNANLNVFLTQIESTVQNTPVSVGGFACKEITFSAAISANGKFVLIGSGVEAGVQGSISFKFAK